MKKRPAYSDSAASKVVAISSTTGVKRISWIIKLHKGKSGRPAWCLHVNLSMQGQIDRQQPRLWCSRLAASSFDSMSGDLCPYLNYFPVLVKHVLYLSRSDIHWQVAHKDDTGHPACMPCVIVKTKRSIGQVYCPSKSAPVLSGRFC